MLPSAGSLNHVFTLLLVIWHWVWKFISIYRSSSKQFVTYKAFMVLLSIFDWDFRLDQTQALHITICFFSATVLVVGTYISLVIYDRRRGLPFTRRGEAILVWSIISIWWKCQFSGKLTGLAFFAPKLPLRRLLPKRLRWNFSCMVENISSPILFLAPQWLGRRVNAWWKRTRRKRQVLLTRSRSWSPNVPRTNCEFQCSDFSFWTWCYGSYDFHF